jgi:toxin HigB-1
VEGGVRRAGPDWRLTDCTVSAYDHAREDPEHPSPGLEGLVEDDDARGIRSDLLGRARNIVAALVAATDMSGVHGLPGWRIHRLSGDRAGTWSISVSGNWRITFDLDDDEIHNLNLEDYH